VDNAKGSSTEMKNDVENITNGLGIFSGKPEISGNIGCLILSLVCLLIAIGFVWGSFDGKTMVKSDIFLTTVSILITVSIISFTAFSFTYPFRARKKIVFEGIWFSKDKIWLGEHEIELKEKCSINNLMDDNLENLIEADWKQSRRASCIDITETLVVVQLENSNFDYKSCRIGKVHIFKEKDNLNYHFASRPTVLLIDGILSSCNTLTLIDQIKKIVKGTKTIQQSGGVCNLCITPPGDIPQGLSNSIENVCDLNNLIKNKTNDQQIMSVLQTEQFIDKAHSDFLITLMKDYGWKIDFCPSKMNVTDQQSKS